MSNTSLAESPFDLAAGPINGAGPPLDVAAGALDVAADATDAAAGALDLVTTALGVVTTSLGVITTSLGVVTTALGVVTTALGVVTTDLTGEDLVDIFILSSSIFTCNQLRNLRILFQDLFEVLRTLSTGFSAYGTRGGGRPCENLYDWHDDHRIPKSVSFVAELVQMQAGEHIV